MYYFSIKIWSIWFTTYPVRRCPLSHSHTHTYLLYSQPRGLNDKAINIKAMGYVLKKHTFNVNPEDPIGLLLGN